MNEDSFFTTIIKYNLHVQTDDCYSYFKQVKFLVDTETTNI